jgi:hypothetical protein
MLRRVRHGARRIRPPLPLTRRSEASHIRQPSEAGFKLAGPIRPRSFVLMFQSSGRWFGGPFARFNRLLLKGHALVWAALWAFCLADPGRAEEPMFRGSPAKQVILENWNKSGWAFYSGTNRALIEEQMGPDIAVPALVSIMQDSDWLGSSTYRDLWTKMPDSIRRTMQPPRGYSRAERALFILGQFGPWASNAIPALVREFEGGDDERKLAVAGALIEMAPASATAADIMGQKLVAAGPESKIGILRLLQQLGPLAQAAIPEIRVQTQDRTNEVRAEAACALWLVARDTNSVLAALRPLILAATPETANAVARTLDEMGPAARPLGLDVLASIPKWPASERNEIFMALGRVAGPRPEAMAFLRSTIEPGSTEPPEALRAAVIALGDIGPAAGDVVPALIALWNRQPPLSFDQKMDRQEAPVRNLVAAIIQSLGKIGSAAQPALPMLEEVWRPKGQKPLIGGSGLAVQAAVAIWQIDQGKTHSAVDLIHDWRESAGPTYDRMATRRSGLRQQLETLWTYQPELVQLLKQGDPDYLRRLTELRESARSKW